MEIILLKSCLLEEFKVPSCANIKLLEVRVPSRPVKVREHNRVLIHTYMAYKILFGAHAGAAQVKK